MRLLPVFENPGPELKTTLFIMDPDLVTGVRYWPHPEYPPDIDGLFRLAAQSWRRYQGEPFDAAAEELEDVAAIATASMDESKAMLSAGVKMERQALMVQRGHLAAILRRLMVLRGERSTL